MSGYDTTLLASAPEATRAQLQEGYNPNLLETGKKKREAEVESPNGKEGSPNTNTAQRRAVPWFRTTQGIITIVVVAIVLIAVIIGGAVGGTRHKNSHVLTGANITSIANTTSTSNSTTTSTESQNVEGATATDTPSSTTSPAPAQSVQSDPQPKPKPPRRRREKRSTRGD